MKHFLIKLALLVYIVLIIGMTLAHQPLWNNGSPTLQEAFRVTEPEVSKAIFGRLKAGELAYFKLDVADNFKLDASLFVGGNCHKAFQPEFWLLTTDPSTDLSKVAPPFPPEGFSARRIPGVWRSYQGHGLAGREGPEVLETLRAGVVYLVVVASEVEGYYLVSLGGREAFGGSAEGREAIPSFNYCG